MSPSIPGEPRRLARPVLREQLKELVLQRILDGTYAPGERIVEGRLMEEFGVSQAPVREMLRELEAMRFVDSQPHRGVRVRAVTRDELAEMYPVRAVLEELAGQLAAPVIADVTLAELDYEVTAMRTAAENGDMHDQIMHDVRFHQLIVAAAGNRMLLDVWSTMHFDVRTLITFQLSTADLPSMAQSHQPILDALRLRDPGLSGKQLHDHFGYARALFMRQEDES